MRPHTIAQTQDAGNWKPLKQQAMAKFEFHGRPETVEALESELPRDGTCWDKFLLEAVRQRKESGPFGKGGTKTAEAFESIRDDLPRKDEEAARYLLESVKLRKDIEARELVLTTPDTRSVEEREKTK